MALAHGAHEARARRHQPFARCRDLILGREEVTPA